MQQAVFFILAVKLREQQGKELKHRPKYKYNTYNYILSPSSFAHPSHRQMPAQSEAIT